MAQQKTLKDWLLEKPFTLSMSSGYFGFFAHCGVCCALADEGLVPQKITGSSAGALIGGSWASGNEPPVIKEHVFGLTKDAFWDPALGWGLLKGIKFQELLERDLKSDTIESCKIPFAPSTFSVYRRQTASHRSGPLADVIRASCSVPFLFQPVRIQNQLHLDGGILDRPGTAGVESDDRVLYHHLIPRSWWRVKQYPTAYLPKIHMMKVIAIKDLPRVNPNRLVDGPQAWKRAYDLVKVILREEVQAFRCV